jgi:hypothetical protein
MFFPMDHGSVAPKVGSCDEMGDFGCKKNMESVTVLKGFFK